MSYCGAINPQSPEIVCERPGEGPRHNHPEHTGKSLSGFLDWPNEAFKPIERHQPGTTRRTTRPSKFKPIMQEMAERTRGGNDER